MIDNGPIIFIDDDPDDQTLFKPLLEQITPQREIIFFESGQKALDFLKSSDERAFLIISEVYMQELNGLEFRREIEKDPVLRRRAIPFIFLTHPIHKSMVEEAYELTIQGFFEKKSNLSAMQTQLQAIVDYWVNCLHPNRFKDDE